MKQLTKVIEQVVAELGFELRSVGLKSQSS